MKPKYAIYNWRPWLNLTRFLDFDHEAARISAWIAPLEVRQVLALSAAKWHRLSQPRDISCACCVMWPGLGGCELCPLSHKTGCCAGRFRNWYYDSTPENQAAVFNYIVGKLREHGVVVRAK